MIQKMLLDRRHQMRLFIESETPAPAAQLSEYFSNIAQKQTNEIKTRTTSCLAFYLFLLGCLGEQSDRARVIVHDFCNFTGSWTES